MAIGDQRTVESTTRCPVCGHQVWRGVVVATVMMRELVDVTDWSCDRCMTSVANVTELVEEEKV